MQNAQQDRAPSTESKYLYRAQNLAIKAFKEASLCGHDVSKVQTAVTKKGISHDALSPYGLAKWASVKWVKNLSPRTWRTYRASIIYWAEQSLITGNISSDAYNKIKELLANKSHLNNRKSSQTSAKKVKHIKGGDLELLIGHLVKIRSKNAKALANWLYANVLVGLRPIEWKTVKVISIGKHKALLVQNAKNTNSRAHGETRVIKLKSFSEKQQKGIVAFAAHCERLSDASDFDAFYEDCRKVLLRANQKLWRNRKKHITLYSTRHQFSADLKKSGRTLIEIAYLMGHASTDTATFHYGKKRYGKNRRTPEVDAEMASKIKRKPARFSFDKSLRVKRSS